LKFSIENRGEIERDKKQREDYLRRTLFNASKPTIF